MTWQAQTKNIGNWFAVSKGGYDFILMENGHYLLLETGYKILLEQSVLKNWQTQTKHTGSWTAQAKS